MTTARSDERERVARLMYEAWPHKDLAAPDRSITPWPEMMERKQEPWLAMADAVLAAGAGPGVDHAECERSILRLSGEIEEGKVDNIVLRMQVATLTHAAEQGADEIASVIPPTFYAGTDTLFRVVQLVRIWQGAIKANHELEHAAEQARTLHAAQWTRIYALLGWPVAQSVSAEQVVGRITELQAQAAEAHRQEGLAVEMAASSAELLGQAEAREGALRDMLQLVWDYGSGCPLSRDCAEIQCDGEACVVSALLIPRADAAPKETR